MGSADEDERPGQAGHDLEAFWRDLFGRPLTYKLDGHTPVPVGDDRLTEPFRQRDQLFRELGFDPWRVAWTEVGEHAVVSTVFLSLDHAFMGPIEVFETMYQLNRHDEESHWELHDRYATWEQAEAGHQACVGELQHRLLR